jgi:hypothetical protein
VSSGPAPIEYLILTLRGKSVMLDADLAAVYGVSVKSLSQSVKRNIDRFPADFMFQLSDAEWSSFEVTICDLKRHSSFEVADRGIKE